MKLLNCGAGEGSQESLGQQGDHISQSQRKSILNIHWKDWCSSSSSDPLDTWCKEPSPWKRAWCWERLKAGGEEDDRGWDGWMASPTQWTWVRANFRRRWRRGKPGVLQPMGPKESDTTSWLNNNSMWQKFCLFTESVWNNLINKVSWFYFFDVWTIFSDLVICFDSHCPRTSRTVKEDSLIAEEC